MFVLFNNKNNNNNNNKSAKTLSIINVFARNDELAKLY